MVENQQPWQLALQELSAELRALYKERLQAVILYGSRARGDADVESDIDVLVVLEPLGDFWEELRAIERIVCPLSLKHSLVVSAFPAGLQEYEGESSSFMANVREEGQRVA